MHSSFIPATSFPASGQKKQFCNCAVSQALEIIPIKTDTLFGYTKLNLITFQICFIKSICANKQQKAVGQKGKEDNAPSTVSSTNIGQLKLSMQS